MARIRTIKPEFFLDEVLFDLEKQTRLPVRLAYAGLWTQADREGRFEWKPRQLKAAIQPHDRLDFAKVLDALERSGRVEHYAVDGREYGRIRSWKRHQVINNKERESNIPPSPDEAMPDGVEATREDRDLDAWPTREDRVTEGKERKPRGERVGNGNRNGNGTGTEQGKEPAGERNVRGTDSFLVTNGPIGTESSPPPPPQRGGTSASSKSTKRAAEHILTSLQLDEPCPIEVIEAACSEAIAMYPNETENWISEQLVNARHLYNKFATDHHKRGVSAEIFFGAGLWKDTEHWAKFLKPSEDMQ